MKHSRIFFLTSFLIIGSFSCSKDSENLEKDNEGNEIENTANYLVLRNTGTDSGGSLFLLGNNNGSVKKFGDLPSIGFNIYFNSVTTASSKIYIYEQNFDPLEGYIHVYDKATGTTIKNTISLPSETYGNSAGLISMDWSEEKGKLIAIVKSEANLSVGTSRIVEINPETFQVQNLNIELEQNVLSISTTLKKNKLYISIIDEIDNSRFKDLIEVNLNQGTYKSLDLKGMDGALYQIASNNTDNMIFGYSVLFGTGRANATEPFIVNLDNGEYIKLLPEFEFGTINAGVKTYYDNASGKLFSLTNASGKECILEYSIKSQEVKLIEIQESGVVQGGAIIDIRE